MSEPKARAQRIETVAPGILRWRIHDERIDWHSDAWAVVKGGRSVLIDPLPLEDDPLASLGKVEAICLTAVSHQRASWSLRKKLGARVYAPEGAGGLDEEPDATFTEGQELPGKLTAVHAPATENTGHVLLSREAGGTLFCGDALIREGETLMFVPDKYLKDVTVPRKTARRILELKFRILCPGHGDPLTSGVHEAIRDLLARDAAATG